MPPTPDYTEKQLLAGIKHRDATICENLVTKATRSLFFAKLQARGVSMAETRVYVTEAFLSLVTQVDGGRVAPRNLTGLLFRIAWRTYLKVVERRKRQEIALAYLSERTFNRGDNAASDQKAQRNAERVRYQINRLSERCKEWLLDYYFGNMKHKEMAEAAQTTVGYTKNKLYECRQKLRRALLEDPGFVL